jgi:AraC-like DNA-binding protein
LKYFYKMNQLLIDKILLIGGFQAFFLAALLIKKKEKALHDFIIGLWLVFLGLYVSVYSLSPEGFFLRNPWLISFYISLLLLIGPVLFWYVKSLIYTNFKPFHKLFLHLLPFFLFNLYLTIFFSYDDFLKSIQSIKGSIVIELPFPYYIFLFITAISIPYYILWSIHLLRAHRKIITNNFSSLEKRNLIWLRNLIIMLGITWILLVAIFFIHHVLLSFSDDFCINGLFLTLSVFIILVGYLGLYQYAIFTSRDSFSPVEDSEDTIKYSGSSLKEEDIQKYRILLDEYMKMGKPYLNNQLTLYQLAEEVNIPPHYLSRIINAYYQQNFFEFINRYRVDEFKKRLIDPKFKNYTLLAIAFDCGFNSKSSFNRLFKKDTGSTPSEYKDLLS